MPKITKVTFPSMPQIVKHPQMHPKFCHHPMTPKTPRTQGDASLRSNKLSNIHKCTSNSATIPHNTQIPSLAFLLFRSNKLLNTHKMHLEFRHYPTTLTTPRVRLPSTQQLSDTYKCTSKVTLGKSAGFDAKERQTTQKCTPILSHHHYYYYSRWDGMGWDGMQYLANP